MNTHNTAKFLCLILVIQFSWKLDLQSRRHILKWLGLKQENTLVNHRTFMNHFRHFITPWSFLDLHLTAWTSRMDKWKLRGSITSWCWVLLHYIWHSINIYLNLDSSKFTPGGKSIFVYGLVFFYQFQNITTLLIIIFNFLKRRNIEKFLKLLETFDDHSEKMGWKFKVNHENNYWSSIFWIGISLILFICVTTYHNIWVPPVPPNLMDYINMICYGFLANALILSSLQFIFSVHSVASRFEVLDQNTKWLIQLIV